MRNWLILNKFLNQTSYNFQIPQTESSQDQIDYVKKKNVLLVNERNRKAKRLGLDPITETKENVNVLPLCQTV